MKRALITRVLLLVVLTSAFVAGRATAKQPMMRDALDHLRAAERALLAATADKGGHREAALRDTRAAIDEVEKGMQFDRRH